MKIVKPGTKKEMVWNPFNVICTCCGAELTLESEKDCANIERAKDIDATTATVYFRCPCCESDVSVETKLSDMYKEITVTLEGKPTIPEHFSGIEIDGEPLSYEDISSSNVHEDEDEFVIEPTGEIPERTVDDVFVLTETREEPVLSSRSLVIGDHYKVNNNGNEVLATYCGSESERVNDKNVFKYKFLSNDNEQFEVSGLELICCHYVSAN